MVSIQRFTRDIFPPPADFAENEDMIAINTPLQRAYCNVSGWKDMTGLQIASKFEREFDLPFQIDDFCILLQSDILQYREVEWGANVQDTTDNLCAQMPGCYLDPRRRIPQRVTFFRDDERTLSQMGFDRHKHVLQIYPARMIHAEATPSERVRLEYLIMWCYGKTRRREPDHSLPLPNPSTITPFKVIERITKTDHEGNAGQKTLTDADITHFIIELTDARKSEDVSAMQSRITKAEQYMNMKKPDGTNLVGGGARKNLQKGIKSTTMTLSDLQKSFTTPNGRLDWLERRRKYQLAKVLDSFTKEDFEQVSTVDRFKPWEAALTRFGFMFGPLFSKALLATTLKFIFERREDKLRDPKSIALPHLAYLLWFYEDGNCGLDKPAGWAECVQRMGATLFGPGKEHFEKKNGGCSSHRLKPEEFALFE